jgi:hypothetical protein
MSFTDIPTGGKVGMLDGSVVSLGAGATVIDGRFPIGFDGEPPFGEGKMDVSCTGGGNDVRNDGWEKALIALDELAAPRSFPATKSETTTTMAIKQNKSPAPRRYIFRLLPCIFAFFEL